jgi:hypothetical protein
MRALLPPFCHLGASVPRVAAPSEASIFGNVANDTKWTEAAQMIAIIPRLGGQKFRPMIAVEFGRGRE